MKSNPECPNCKFDEDMESHIYDEVEESDIEIDIDPELLQNKECIGCDKEDCCDCPHAEID